MHSLTDLGRSVRNGPEDRRLDQCILKNMANLQLMPRPQSHSFRVDLPDSIRLQGPNVWRNYSNAFYVGLVFEHKEETNEIQGSPMK